MRYKIADKVRAKGLGITEIIPDAEGIVELDVALIPCGWTIQDWVDRAVREGILIVLTPPEQKKGQD